MQGIEKEYTTNIGNQDRLSGTEVNDPTAASHKLGTNAVDRYGMTIDQQEKLASIHAQMEANSGAWLTASEKRRGDLEQANRDKAAEANALLNQAGHQLVFNPADGEWYLDKIGGERFYDVYHKGGIVGSDEEFAKLQKGELVVPKEHVKPTMKMLEWGNTLASKMRGLFSGGGLFPPVVRDAIKSAPPSPAAGAIVNNNAPSFAPQIQVEVKYDSSASPADAKRFGANIAVGITETFRRRGVGQITDPLLTRV